MDPVDPMILTAAYLLAHKALDGAVEEAGRSAWSGFESFMARVRNKFRGDDDAALALERIEAGSVDEGDVVALSEHLQRHVESDSSFLENVRETVAAARANTVMSTDIHGHATVGKVVNINTAGDVSF